MTTLDELRTRLDQLLKEVVEAAKSSGKQIGDLRGVAFFNPLKDGFITSLAQFPAFESSLRELQLACERYGEGAAHRIALQLVYEYFAQTDGVLLDPLVSNTLWENFVAELESPFWITRAITNLRHFRYDELRVDLGDGVSIYGRVPETLIALGFPKAILDRINADWGGFGSSSYVLVAEVKTPKAPDNLILLNNVEPWLHCARAVGAMRLIAPGDIGMSVTFVHRVARFNVGLGGIVSTGATLDTIGLPFTWSSVNLPLYGSTYAALARLEKSGYRQSPGNLDIALRYFNSTYDRFPLFADSKLVDSVTALEAVLGSETEIAFKLAFRVTSLLAKTDDERAVLLKQVKAFYDTRSRIIHGGRLGKKHEASIAAVDELRALVRRLLRSFVEFAADDTRSAEKKLFTEDLDAFLTHNERREQLRKLLGLENVTSSEPPPTGLRS